MGEAWNHQGFASFRVKREFMGRLYFVSMGFSAFSNTASTAS